MLRSNDVTPDDCDGVNDRHDYPYASDASNGWEPALQTNGQTTEALADLHEKRIFGEASVATMVWWLWSWAVTTEIVVQS